MAVTDPLREEHRSLLPHVEQLRTAGEAVDRLPAGALRAALAYTSASSPGARSSIRPIRLPGRCLTISSPTIAQATVKRALPPRPIRMWW